MLDPASSPLSPLPDLSVETVSSAVVPVPSVNHTYTITPTPTILSSCVLDLTDTVSGRTSVPCRLHRLTNCTCRFEVSTYCSSKCSFDCKCLSLLRTGIEIDIERAFVVAKNSNTFALHKARRIPDAQHGPLYYMAINVAFTDTFSTQFSHLIFFLTDETAKVIRNALVMDALAKKELQPISRYWITTANKTKILFKWCGTDHALVPTNISIMSALCVNTTCLRRKRPRSPQTDSDGRSPPLGKDKKRREKETPVAKKPPLADPPDVTKQVTVGLPPFMGGPVQFALREDGSMVSVPFNRLLISGAVYSMSCTLTPCPDVPSSARHLPFAPQSPFYVPPFAPAPFMFPMYGNLQMPLFSFIPK